MPDAFGASTDGSDGGAFVEFENIVDGAGVTPFENLEDAAFSTLTYQSVWFKHAASKDNFIYLLGAKNWDMVGRVGVTNSAYNYSVVSVGTIESAYAADDRPASIRDTTVHELGHQFGLNNVDNIHIPHANSINPLDKCVMDYDCDEVDNISEFCADSPNHIWDIRQAGEPR